MKTVSTIVLTLAALTATTCSAQNGDRSDENSESEILRSMQILLDLDATRLPAGPLDGRRWMINRRSRAGSFFTGGSTGSGRYTLFTHRATDTARTPGTTFKPGTALHLNLHGWGNEPKKGAYYFHYGYTGNTSYSSLKQEPMPCQIAFPATADEAWDKQLKLTVAYDANSPGISFGRWPAEKESSHRMTFDEANWKTDATNSVVFQFEEESVALWVNGECIDVHRNPAKENSFATCQLQGMFRNMGASLIRVLKRPEAVAKPASSERRQ